MIQTLTPTSTQTLQHLAVVKLGRYNLAGGVGRVLGNLTRHWQTQLTLSEASFRKLELPLLRNLPLGLHTKGNVQVVLFPQLTGASALRFSKLPSVVIVHDVGIADFPEDNAERPWLDQRLVKQSFRDLRFASHIVTVSEFSKTRLLEHLPALKNRVTAIPNGVDDLFLRYNSSKEQARSKLEQALSKKLQAPLLLYVGSEIKRKNLPLLLETLRDLKQRYPKAQLIKIGKPGHPRWREHTLAHLDGLELGKDILFLENASDELLCAAYRAADVFVSASLYEGFGLPALEAMAVGTPVVVSDTSAFPEVLSQVGKVVAPTRAAYVTALYEVLKNPVEAEALRQHARSFSWSHAAARYLEVLGRVLAESRQ
jgi:glycosyltransferase involved in cell wall biosynthesis